MTCGFSAGRKRQAMFESRFSKPFINYLKTNDLYNEWLQASIEDEVRRNNMNVKGWSCSRCPTPEWILRLLIAEKLFWESI